MLILDCESQQNRIVQVTRLEVNQGDENGKGYGRPRGCSGTERQSWLDNLKLRPGTEFEKQQLDIDFSEETYLKYSSKGMDGRYIAHNRYSDMIPGKLYYSGQILRL